MKAKKFPVTQVTISNKIGRPIDSIIRMSNLKDFYIQPDLCLNSFQDFFESIPWETVSPNSSNSYKTVTIELKVNLKGLRFFIAKEKNNVPVDYFFNKDHETKTIHHLVGSLTSQYYKFIRKELDQEIVNIEIGFSRIIVSPNHELIDQNYGSLIILNRKNVFGGESVLTEKKDQHSNEAIFQRELKAGDFVFIKNKKNQTASIIHQFSPIQLEDQSKKEGWLDFIQFKIVDV